MSGVGPTGGAGPEQAGPGLRIFLNYRREDTRGDAGRLYDDLVERFGDRQVFRDVDTLEAGEDFNVAIDRAVKSCDVVIALVGERWLTVNDASGRRRIDNPDDFVRLELEAALAGDVRIVPIRVEGADMPSVEELPLELARFAKKHALEISDSRWRHDCDRVISTLERIEKTLGVEGAERGTPEWAQAEHLEAERVDAHRVSLQVGSVFAGYLIEAEAGRGGMGVVYRARSVITEREVALKVLAPELAQDIHFRARFKRESRLAARLEHEHVIPLYHAGEEEGLLYLVMRYVEGTDLRSLLLDRGALPPARAVQIVAQIAGALDAAHVGGLIHRDVKPANVLIEGNGDGPAYLTDFGLVKELSSDSSLTETGVFMGTYHYAAPEQFDSNEFGPVSPRTDVYALGCVLYHCLTGEAPYSRDTPGAILAAHMLQAPPDVRAGRPELPFPLTAVIERALAKRPEQRYATARELATAAIAATRPEPAETEGDAKPERQGAERAERERLERTERQAARPAGQLPAAADAAVGRAADESPRPASEASDAARRWRRRRPVLLAALGAAGVLVAVLALLLVSKGSTSGGTVPQPKPGEPISAVIPLLNKAINDQSCAEFLPLDFSQGRQTTKPGAPPFGTECQVIKPLLERSKNFKFTNGAEYGTAALLEGPPTPGAVKRGRDRSVALFILDRDGHYRFVWNDESRHQIGTKPSAGADDHGRNAQAVVDAIRAEDCTKLVPLIDPTGPLASSYSRDRRATCTAFTNGTVFAPAVKATKFPKAVQLGRTRDFHIYGVSTTKGYFTLVMATPATNGDLPPRMFDLRSNTDNPGIPERQPPQQQ